MTQTNNNGIATFVTNSSEYSFASFYHQFPSGNLTKNNYYFYSVLVRVTSGNCSRIEIDHHGSRVDYVDNPVTNNWYRLTGIIKQTLENTQNTNAFDVVRRYSSTSDIVVNSDSFQAQKPMFVDLTVGFGVGKEPTSINDWRIQYIIEHGHIPTDTEGTWVDEEPDVLPNVTLNLKSK